MPPRTYNTSHDQNFEMGEVEDIPTDEDENGKDLYVM